MGTYIHVHTPCIYTFWTHLGMIRAAHFAQNSLFTVHLKNQPNLILVKTFTNIQLCFRIQAWIRKHLYRYQIKLIFYKDRKQTILNKMLCTPRYGSKVHMYAVYVHECMYL